MSKQHDHISPELADWISQQRMFFVATAPLAATGHINTSPKGGDSFRMLGPRRVAYQDYTGSGAETVAHLRENGRIVVMFCAFEGAPKIVRLHGIGRVLAAGDPHFAELALHFPGNPGTRAFIEIEVTRVSDSCGMSVPYYDFKQSRDSLDRWAAKKGPEELEAYRVAKNRKSIDELPSFDFE